MDTARKLRNLTHLEAAQVGLSSVTNRVYHVNE